MWSSSDTLSGTARTASVGCPSPLTAVNSRAFGSGSRAWSRALDGWSRPLNGGSRASNGWSRPSRRCEDESELTSSFSGTSRASASSLRCSLNADITPTPALFASDLGRTWHAWRECCRK
eukprot:2255603-Rhodomonas_salina.1